MKNRGLYHQPDGSEKRPDTEVVNERYLDNQTIEGEMVEVLRLRFLEQDWNNFNKMVGKLKTEGYSQSRIDSMINRAIYRGLKTRKSSSRDIY